MSWIQVLEETGFDVSELLNEDEHIEMIFGQQRVRLYIVSGVKEDTYFAPQTKKEISVCHSPSEISEFKKSLKIHCFFTSCISLYFFCITVLF